MYVYVSRERSQFNMRRTKEEAAQTREAILNAALYIFLDKGVYKSTLDEIATQAGVTRGAIYWHFKNKIEIFDALHQRLQTPLVEMIMQDIEKDHPNPLLQLHDLCVNLLIDIEKTPEKKQALTLFLIKCDYSCALAPYKEKHRRRKQENLALFQQYFDRAIEKGKLPSDADPALLTLSITCYMKGIIYEYLDNPDSFSLEERARPLMTLFFSDMT